MQSPKRKTKSDEISEHIRRKPTYSKVIAPRKSKMELPENDEDSSIESEESAEEDEELQEKVRTTTAGLPFPASQ
jgi:hypothetical protein